MTTGTSVRTGRTDRTPRPVRRRLGPEARRDQLVRAGSELLFRMPFDQVTAEHVAHAAGVSKALVFHYFPTTRELQATLLRAVAEELLASLDVDPTAAPAERLRLGIARFIDFIERAPDNYQAMARGSGSDPVLNEVVDVTRDGVVALVQRVLGAPELPPGLAIALRGWIAFVEESALHWLTLGRRVDRDALVDFLAETAIRMLPDAVAMTSH